MHEKLPGESIQEAAQRLQRGRLSTEHLKLSVEVNSFGDLEEGLAWQAEDPQNRSFLPRSKEGRWVWARQWLRGRQKLNFVQEGVGTSLDQPSFYEWIGSVSAPLRFAAVLGFPVEHSFSPIEQGPYFRAQGIPFFRIAIQEAEWEGALSVLNKRGLCAAAITSPLKRKAYELAENLSEISKELQSANSIFVGKKVSADNTDFIGFTELIKELDLPEPIVIWGGGGTLKMIQKAISNCIPYSARTAKSRTGQEVGAPLTLIWATGNQGPFPKQNWRPKILIDLNYRDDSLAREYAKKTGAKYISGLFMFKKQAEAQRKFWNQYLNERE